MIRIFCFSIHGSLMFIDFVDFTCSILSRFAKVLGCEIHCILCYEVK